MKKAFTLIELLVVMAIMSFLFMLNGCTTPCERVSRWKAQGNVKRLINALDSRNLELRARAAYALYWVRDPRAVEPLIATLKSTLKNNCTSVSTACVKALGGIGDVRAVRSVIAVLQDDNLGVHLRATAARALGKMKDPRAVEPLIAALKGDAEPWVRSFAAYALGTLGRRGHTRVVQALIAALNDEDAKVRGKTASALGKVGDASAVPPLIDALQDEDAKVRGRTASALGRIGDARAVPPLIDALQDEDAKVRGYVARTLGEIGDARAVQPLISALTDSSCWSSMEEGPGRYIEYYWNPYGSRKFFPVRELAEEALQCITGEDFDEDQAKWRDWWDKKAI